MRSGVPAPRYQLIENRIKELPLAHPKKFVTAERRLGLILPSVCSISTASIEDDPEPEPGGGAATEIMDLR